MNLLLKIATECRPLFLAGRVKACSSCRLWVLPVRNSLPQESLASGESLTNVHIHSREAHYDGMQASNSGRIQGGAAFELMSKRDLLAHALLLESMLQKYGASFTDAYKPLKVRISMRSWPECN